MTKNYSMTVSFAEIRAIEARGPNCSGIVVYPLGYAVANFLNCPGCGNTLVDNGPVGSALFKLHAALTEWNKVAPKPVNLTFTVDIPGEAQGQK